MSPVLAFVLGVAAMWMFEHFFTSPKLPVGKGAHG